MAETGTDGGIRKIWMRGWMIFYSIWRKTAEAADTITASGGRRSPGGACLVPCRRQTASGMYQALDGKLNLLKLRVFAQLQEANVSADTYNRPMTENEDMRLEELRAGIDRVGISRRSFTLINITRKIQKGSGFLCRASRYLSCLEKRLSG